MSVIDADFASLLRLSRIGKRFGQTAALADVDLEVPRGSFTCLVGPSGCGKTTLLRCICGLEKADLGRIVCAGCDITHLPASARRMGMVFQSYALFPNLSVGRNVAYGLSRSMGRSEKRRKVDALLDAVGLSGYGARRPEELSGGQQQRVAIARALAPEPSVLLLDEPLSALDAQLRVQVRTELKSLQRRLGVTTVMVTHDQAEALAVADRIVLMKQGRVVQAGSPFDLYFRPVDQFVAGFLGRMNFLPAEVMGPGTIKLESGQTITVNTEGHLPGSMLVVGIRPEDMVLSPMAEGDGIHLCLRILRREFLGANMRLETIHAGSEAALVLDVPLRLGRTLDEDTEIDAFLPSARMHLFAAGRG